MNTVAALIFSVSALLGDVGLKVVAHQTAIQGVENFVADVAVFLLILYLYGKFTGRW